MFSTPVIQCRQSKKGTKCYALSQKDKELTGARGIPNTHTKKEELFFFCKLAQAAVKERGKLRRRDTHFAHTHDDEDDPEMFSRKEKE